MSLPAELRGPSVLLQNPTTINVIVGRNGAGKSRFLRNMQTVISEPIVPKISYVSPERAGVFNKELGAEMNYRSIPNFLRDSRAVNQAAGFKNLSAVLLEDLETLFARKMQNDRTLREDFSRTFVSEYLDKINGLLSNVAIEQSSTNLKSFIFRSSSGDIINAEALSSGEAEIVALATEIMYFFTTIDVSRFNIFILDEPDVHLHPDLQARLARFIISQINGLDDLERGSIMVILATHSTPFICELSVSELTSIGIKNFNSDVVVQQPIDNNLRKTAPFFGHPLSKCISADPILILEGDDDERVWQQAARTSQGKIKLFPCLAKSVNQQGELEIFCSEMLNAIYDQPIAFSLRDGDGVIMPLDDIGSVKRFRLGCYSIENLLLSDEALLGLGSSWVDFVNKAQSWIGINSSHKSVAFLNSLIASNDRFRHRKIKEIRNLICPILGSQKPWEVHVGQTIGSLSLDGSVIRSSNSIVDWIGEQALRSLYAQ